jgi:hypothetical protein
MIEPPDIYRSAWTMLRHYGADAPAEAEKRARDMRDAGDSDGEVFWQRVATAIDELIAERSKAED